MSTRRLISVFFTCAVLSVAAACTSAEVAARESKAAAVSTVNGFYDVIEDANSYSEIEQMHVKYQHLTKEEKLGKVSTEMRGMEFFDTSSEEHIIDAYLMLAGGVQSSQELRATSAGSSSGEVKITIPPEAVVIAGDMAMVDLSKGMLTVDGTPAANPESGDGDYTLKMTRLPSGKWVLNPVS